MHRRPAPGPTAPNHLPPPDCPPAVHPASTLTGDDGGTRWTDRMPDLIAGLTAPDRASACWPSPSPRQSCWWRSARTPASPGRPAPFLPRFGEPAERFVGRKLSSLIAPADRAALGRTLIDAAMCGLMPPVMLRLSDAAGTPCAFAALDYAGTAAPAVRDAWAGADRAAGESRRCAARVAVRQGGRARLRDKPAADLALLDIKGWPAATDDAGRAAARAHCAMRSAKRSAAWPVLKPSSARSPTAAMACSASGRSTSPCSPRGWKH